MKLREDTRRRRFWDKVNIVNDETSCWEWKSSRNHRGYGVGKLNHKRMNAHRLGWLLMNGPIPDGLLVRHKCDNPPCVRIDHLELGTPADNVADMYTRGRGRKGDTHPNRIDKTRVQGERHPGAKLTNAQVQEIRLSPESIETFALRYGMNRKYLSKIRKGTARTTN